MTLLLHPDRVDADATTGTSLSDTQQPGSLLAPLNLDPAGVFGPAMAGDDDFVLDMRVVESTTPLVVMMCSTSDGCGSSCSTSACTTKSSDPT